MTRDIGHSQIRLSHLMLFVATRGFSIHTIGVVHVHPCEAIFELMGHFEKKGSGLRG
jgi:hypothetical protein